MSVVPPPASTPASTAQALGMLESAMGYLSAADATAMAAQTQAQALMALERVHSMGTAARASILAIGQGDEFLAAVCADTDQHQQVLVGVEAVFGVVLIGLFLNAIAQKWGNGSPAR